MSIETTVSSEQAITSEASSAFPTQPAQPAQVRRRVLQVINGEHYSGAERVQDLLGLQLPEFGYEAAFACIKPNKFPLKRASRDLTLYEIPMKSKLDFSAARRLAQVARFAGFDLLHAHGVRSLLVTRVAASLAKLPFVYHVHSPTSEETTHRLSNRINAAIERICLTGVSRLICVSQSLAQHMQNQGYASDLIHVVANGVPCQKEPAPRATPEHSWVLGTIALFRPRKGVEVLIEAIALLRQRGHDVRLRAVGPFETPSYEAKIRSLAERHQLQHAIEWVGFSSDVNAELEKMDVMVLPSLFGEGLPMVVLESMAAGVPVVGTEVEGVPEVLQPGAGILAKPGCARALADQIESLLSGKVDWQLVRKRGWLRQSELFSDRSMAHGVANAYDHVLAQLSTR